MSDYCICKDCGCKHLVWEKSCPYCRRITELETILREIANIAHYGGLMGKDNSDIRRLTLPYWDKAECQRLQLEKNDE